MDQNIDDLINQWPEQSQKSARTTIEKYGQPDEYTADMLAWHHNGPWKTHHRAPQGNSATTSPCRIRTCWKMSSITRRRWRSMMTRPSSMAVPGSNAPRAR